MSEANVLVQMTIEKARLVEELIIRFLGRKPSWQERKEFRIMSKLGESSVYHKGLFVGTVYYEPSVETN